MHKTLFSTITKRRPTRNRVVLYTYTARIIYVFRFGVLSFIIISRTIYTEGTKVPSHDWYMNFSFRRIVVLAVIT